MLILYKVPPEEIHYNDPTPVSSGRFSEATDFPMYDAKHIMTMRIPVPELKRMTYATIEEIFVDAWVWPTTVELKIPVAIAKARKTQAAGRALVTRERTPTSMATTLLPSNYAKFEESIQMAPDPVLRAYFRKL